MAEFFNNTIAKVMAALNKIMWPAPRAEAAIIEKGQILVIKSDQELFLPGGRVKTGEAFGRSSDTGVL